MRMPKFRRPPILDFIRGAHRQNQNAAAAGGRRIEEVDNEMEVWIRKWDNGDGRSTQITLPIV